MKHRFVLTISSLAVLTCLLCGCGETDTAAGQPIVAPPPDFGNNDRTVCVAMGDSITVGHNGPDATLAGYTVLLAPMIGRTIINEAIDGSDTGDGKGIVNRVLRDHKPAYLLILYGANDVISGMHTTQSIANLRTIIQAAKTNQTVPIITTLLPMSGPHKFFAGGVVHLNTEIRQLAQDEAVALVDLYTVFAITAIATDVLGLQSPLMTHDGLHPNDDGQHVIAQEFALGVDWAPVVVP